MITTGGTIEKTYDENDGLMVNRRSVVEDCVLSKLRFPYTDVNVRPVLSKDSLHMLEKDRKKLVNVILQFMDENNPIIVLHGTDTMEKSVQFCMEKILKPTVPIIFTGAMLPLPMEGSDAMQNIVESMMAAKILGPGIYLSFHNRIFYDGKFEKNRKLKTFGSTKK